jgi:hypothetical protein
MGCLPSQDTWDSAWNQGGNIWLVKSKIREWLRPTYSFGHGDNQRGNEAETTPLLSEAVVPCVHSFMLSKASNVQ